MGLQAPLIIATRKPDDAPRGWTILRGHPVGGGLADRFSLYKSPQAVAGRLAKEDVASTCPERKALCRLELWAAQAGRAVAILKPLDEQRV